MPEHVRLFNESCPSLADLLAELRTRPTCRLGLLTIGGTTDGRRAAIVWKHLFLIALKCLGIQQDSLARVTAVEALTVLTRVSSSTTFPARAALSAIRHRTYGTGQLQPRPFLHPEDLLLHYAQAAKALAGKSVAESSIVAVWRRWKAGRIPDDLIGEVTRLRSTHQRAVYIIHRAFGYASEDSVQTLLTDARKATDFPTRQHPKLLKRSRQEKS